MTNDVPRKIGDGKGAWPVVAEVWIYATTAGFLIVRVLGSRLMEHFSHFLSKH